MNADHHRESEPPEPSDAALPNELKGFEARLISLRPREDRLDRERLMFLAGRASVNESRQHASAVRRWVWPASLGAMTTATTMLVMTTLPPTASPDKANETMNADIAVRSAPEPGAGISTGRELMAGASLQNMRRWLSTEHADWPATDFAATNMGESVAETPILSTRSLDGIL